MKYTNLINLVEYVCVVSMALPFGVGTWEILLIILIAIMLFGPKKIPELAKSIKQAIKEFKKSTSELEEEEKEEISSEEIRKVLIELAKEKESSEKTGKESD